MKTLSINILTVLALLFIGSAPLTGQNTVGLLSYDLANVYNGYNLLYPHNQPNVYLLNNCGEVVHMWEDDADWRPGNTAYLMENGNLVKTKRSSVVQGNPIWAGGGGGTVEIRSWENELLWTFTLNDTLYRLHHDIEPMPNGNILMIVWEKKTREEAIEAGRNPDLLPDDEVWSDYVIEVEPIGTDSFNIVWEWHVWDHLVQDFDDTQENFGVVGDHNELIDINFTTNEGQADWLHSNAIDYNPFIDQILFCTPFLSEVWIIDHSTTTEEAAGHTGGMQGRGGDLLFRWGNNQVFDQGDEDDKQLFNPHDPHWIDDFVTGSHPDAGKIAVYNNQAGSNYSTVNIFAPFFDMYEGYAVLGETYAPADFDYTYAHPDTALTYSTGLSSVQILPNDNKLICAGRSGYAYELNADEEVIWEYRTPLKMGAAVEQGSEPSINDNLTFRFKRYPKSYEAFDGRDLSPKGFIETNPDTTFCDITTSVQQPPKKPAPRVFPNPVTYRLTVEWEEGGKGAITLYDNLGRVAYETEEYGGRAFVMVDQLVPGVYFLVVNDSEPSRIVVH